ETEIGELELAVTERDIGGSDRSPTFRGGRAIADAVGHLETDEELLPEPNNDFPFAGSSRHLPVVSKRLDRKLSVAAVERLIRKMASSSAPDVPADFICSSINRRLQGEPVCLATLN
ncbi:MAG: hypothetical protein WD065_19210, partial [Planctomycetaceae bacterium]